MADDSEDDRMLLRSAMIHASRMQIMAEVTNGEETISHLTRCIETERSGLALPDLLLLDLKMPVQDGFAVLEWLRPRHLGTMTVVVLTNAVQPDHISRALNLGADFFQVKPRNQKDCVTMVLALEERLVNGLRTAPSHSSAALSRYHQMA